MSMKLAQRYVELTRRKRELASELRQVNEALSEGEALLLAEIEEGRFPQSAKVDGMTLYLSKTTWVSPRDGDYAAACDALEAVGLAEFSQRRFNTQTVSAFVREQEKMGIELPDRLKDALNITERFTVGARAS